MTTIPIWFGISAIVVGVFCLIMKILVWISAGAGESGGAPELDGIIVPQTYLLFGLYLLIYPYFIPAWVYFLLWLSLAALFYFIMRWMHELGEQRAGKRPDGKTERELRSQARRQRREERNRIKQNGAAAEKEP